MTVRPRTSTKAEMVLLMGTAVLLGTAVPASAQIPFAGGKLSGVLDVGGRAYLDRPNDTEWAKFAEYRNLSAGAYLPYASFRFNSGDRLFAELRGFNVARDDQRLAFGIYNPGRFALDVSWNQTPHSYSTTSRLYGGQSSPGVFPLPTPRPTATDFNNAPVLGNVGVRWDAARVALRLTPPGNWNLQVEYTRTGKKGDRPMGMAMGSPGSNTREILEPIDQTVHSFKVSQGLGKSRYRLQVTYDLSVFQNDLSQVEADNPGSAVDVAGGAPARGVTALAPDNLAHTLSLSGVAADFPLQTRLAGSFSYGWWLQNQGFLPYTRNPTITTGALPVPSLNGDQRSLNLNLTATSRPGRNVSLTAKYRRYQREDKTPAVTFPLKVVSDRTLSTGPLEREFHPYGRHNGRLELGWRPAGAAHLKLGWNWDQWDREDEREAHLTNEHTPRAALDLTVTDWLLLRTSYSHGWRRFDSYTQVAAAQNPELRKFDMADRNQDRIDIIAQLTPPRQFGITLSYGLGKNDFPNSSYGVQDDHNWVLGGDVSWTPSDRASFYVTYAHERFKVQQRSRYREPPLQLNNLSYDWIGRNNDKVNTTGAGLELRLVPNKLELGAQLSLHDATTDMLGENPTAPTGGTAAQNLSATAANFPSITHTFAELDASLRYRFASNWSATVRYVYERMTEQSFQSDGLLPAPPPPAPQGDIFLGNDILPYRAGWLAITLGYNIGMAPRALMSR